MRAFTSNVFLITLCLLGTSFAAPVTDIEQDLTASKTVNVVHTWAESSYIVPSATATMVPEYDSDASDESTVKRYACPYKHYPAQSYSSGVKCVKDDSVDQFVDKIPTKTHHHIPGPRDASSRSSLLNKANVSRNVPGPRDASSSLELENKAIASMADTRLKLQQAMQEVQRCQVILQVVGVEEYNRDFKDCMDKMALLDFDLEWVIQKMGE